MTPAAGVMFGELLGFASEYWAVTLAVFGRVAGVLVLLPGIGAQSVPRRMLATLAFLLAAAIAPRFVQESPTDHVGLATLVVSESAVGLVIGVWVRCVVFSIQSAGAVAAQQMGLQLFVGQPMDGENEAPATRFLTLAAVTTFLAANVHLVVLQGFAESYTLIPFGSWPTALLIAPDLVESLGQSFLLAVQLAGPFLVAGVAFNMMLGVVNRAMPQLMVVLVGAPALALGMLALFALALPAMLGGWIDGFERLLPELILGAADG